MEAKCTWGFLLSFQQTDSQIILTFLS